MNSDSTDLEWGLEFKKLHFLKKHSWNAQASGSQTPPWIASVYVSLHKDNTQILYTVYDQKSVCIYTLKHQINKTRLETYQLLKEIWGHG